MSYVGKIVKCIVPFYDSKLHKKSFKYRPALIIAEPAIGAVDDDFTVLPLSRITYSQNINPNYDLIIDKQIYPKLGLVASISYLRTHKQTTVNKRDLDLVHFIGDLKTEYPSLFYEALTKMQQFQEEIILNA